MGISKKLRAAMKLLKEIEHEYSIMTRKNKCIPGTRKKGSRISRKGKETRKKVNFSTVEEPVEEPVQAPAEVIEPSPENPFEEAEEGPMEEPEGTTNPLEDGLTETKD